MIRFLQTPGRAKKIFLSGILVVICFAMVAYLGNSFSSIGSNALGAGAVARVDGVEIGAADVLREAQSMARRQFGGRAPAQFVPFFAKQAADQLILKQALIRSADNLGLRVSDEELQDELQHGQLGATLFPGGKFIGQPAYEEFARQNELSVKQLEQVERDFILIRKLQSLISAGAVVTDAEILQAIQQSNTKVKFEYAVLTPDVIAKGLHPADAEIKAFYEQKKASYVNSIPEKRKIRYALIETSKLQTQVKVSPGEIRSYYQQHQDQYRVPEQVSVRHILVKTPPAGPDGKVDTKAVDAARAKAQELLKQVKSGADFANLAQKSSDDPGSAKAGGSLGWIQRGRTVPEFEKASFSLPKGETSDLVQSTFGFHIIHVDDKQSAHLKPVEEVKSEIEPLLLQQVAARQSEVQASALLTQAKSGGLEKAAVARGVNLITTDFLAHSDTLPGIGAAPELMNAVFTAREKAPPEMIQTTSGYALFELAEIKPPATPAFEDIRSRVESEYKSERTNTLLGQKIQELSDRARAQHDLKKAAKEVGAEVKTSDFVLPTSQVPGIGAMNGSASVAFTMKAGDISGPLNAGNGGAVLHILERQEPTAGEIVAKKPETRDALLESKRGEIFNIYVTNTRQQMEKAGKIHIDEEALKRAAQSRGGEGE